jgi:RNA polymerase sigma factor (sigma-70 family)
MRNFFRTGSSTRRERDEVQFGGSGARSPKETGTIMDRMWVSEEATLAKIEAVYRSRFADFLRVSTAITGSLESGRDAVHEAMVSSVRSRRTYRGEGTVEAWLWRAVVNAARKRRRDERDLPVRDGQPEPSLVWNDRRPGDEFADLRTAIRALPERQRLVLFLRYYADLDYGAIAVVLGIRLGTVGAALNAAHAALRGRIREVTNT